MTSGRSWPRGQKRGGGPSHSTHPNTPHHWEGQEGNSRMMRSSSVPRDLASYSYPNSQQPWTSNCFNNQDAWNRNSGWNGNGWQQGYMPGAWEEDDIRRGRTYMEDHCQGRFRWDNNQRARGYKFRNRDSRPRNRGRGAVTPYEGRDFRCGSVPREIEYKHVRRENGSIQQERRVQLLKGHCDEPRVDKHENGSLSDPRLQVDGDGAPRHQRPQLKQLSNSNLSQYEANLHAHTSVPHPRVTSLTVKGDLKNKEQSASQMTTQKTIAREKMDGWPVKEKTIMNDLQIEEYDNSEPATVPDLYDPNIAIGGSLVIPEIFYFCTACKVYMKKNVNKHLRGVIHFNNLKQGGGVLSDLRSQEGLSNKTDVGWTSVIGKEKLPVGEETQPQRPLESAPLPTCTSTIEYMELDQVAPWDEGPDLPTLEDCLDFE